MMDAIFTISYGWGGVRRELLSMRHRQDDVADNEHGDGDDVIRDTDTSI